MFDAVGMEALPDDPGALDDRTPEDWRVGFREHADPPRSPANTDPSGWLALELDAATTELDPLTDADLIDAIIGFDRVTSWAAARQARLLAEFARRRPGDDPTAVTARNASEGSDYAPDEIGLALHLARGTAGARLDEASRLVRILPATLALWERGQLDQSKVRAIVDAVYYLSREHAAAVEARILPKAPEQTRGQLGAALARAVIAIDPRGAAERHRAARRDRRVVKGDEVDGMASLWALLAAPDALASYEWLTRLARSLGAEDPRGMDARRADLMVELLTGQCAIVPTDTDTDTDTRGDVAGDATATASAAPASTADRAARTPSDHADPTPPPATTPPAVGSDAASGPSGPCVADKSAADTPAVGPARARRAPAAPGKPLIHVIIPYSTLTGVDDQPCELTGYGPIPADLARTIAADAVWKRLLIDPLSGAVLDHGRTTYRPPQALTDFVQARDVHCRSPICRRSARTSELDHTIAWDDGGATADWNLYAGCTHDHHAKHAAGWSVSQERDGRITWTTPTGHRYTSHPHDYRPEPDPEPPPPTTPPTRDPGPARPPRTRPRPIPAELWKLPALDPSDLDPDPPPF